MLIDCDTCAMRDIACSDCVITMLFGGSSQTELDDDECRAVDLLAEAGLVAPLRLVHCSHHRPVPAAGGGPLRSNDISFVLDSGQVARGALLLCPRLP